MLLVLGKVITSEGFAAERVVGWVDRISVGAVWVGRENRTSGSVVLGIVCGEDSVNVCFDARDFDV